MIERRWVQSNVDEAAIETLVRGAELDRSTARLLVSRGVHGLCAVESFLTPRLADLPNPELMKGLPKAAKRLADAITQRHRIALYGDYDVDGVTSTSLLAAFLKEHGVEARTYIPKRLTEGYGLNDDAVETLAAEGTQLLITLDCGITAAREVARANRHGIDCVVVDHHRCPPDLPDAFATLNPQQAGCTYPDKGLAAVGVCFNLVIGARKVLRDRGHYELREQPNLRRFMDLVALGTIADMVPLSGVNRLLAWHGLQEIRAARRPGIRALMEVSKVRSSRCSSTDVSFRLGPRINAAGRLSDAAIGVRLMLSDDIAEARPIAETLDAANAQRQKIEAEVFTAAVDQVEAEDEVPPAIVLYDESWHPGVVGIVASKLVERYARPTIIIGEGGRGSGRTARGLHLYDAMNDSNEYLMKFGGHRAAAGMTLFPGKYDDFKAAFEERVEGDPDAAQGEVLLTYDDKLQPDQFSWKFASDLELLQPFGNGNPQPLFMTEGMSVKSRKIVGHDHLKLRLNEGGKGGIEAIAFKRGELYDDLVPGRNLDLAYHLEKSEFSGFEYLELRVRDVHLSE